MARELAAAGCAVTAIVGTRSESVTAARAALAERYGIEARGYTSLEELLAQEQVDLVAICSPHEAHLPQLEAAAAAGCHVFCEKPLWWREDLDPAGVEAAVDRLLGRLAPGRALGLNTQWPYTLPAFRELYPGVAEAPLERFSLHLAPDNPTPRRMLVDSGSHLLSLLEALAGPGELVEPRCEQLPGPGPGFALRCDYRHARATAEVELLLRPCPSVPRPAGYAINGRSLERRIEQPGYRFFFEAEDGRRVSAPDPLVGCVRAFVQSAEAGRAPQRARILAGMTQLLQLVSASTQEVVWPSP